MKFFNGTSHRATPKFGRAAVCEAIFYPTIKEGAVSWSWFPDFSWVLIGFLVAALFTLIGIFMIIAAATSKAVQDDAFGATSTTEEVKDSYAVVLSFGILFLIGGLVGDFALGNWLWNMNKQDAYSLALGKRIEAEKLWASVDPTQRFLAKDTFYQTQYGGKTLRVLRDGSIEVEGGHKDNTDFDWRAGKLAANAVENALP